MSNSSPQSVLLQGPFNIGETIGDEFLLSLFSVNK